MRCLTRVTVLLVLLSALLATAVATARTGTPPGGPLAEVVVTLPQPSLADAIQEDRVLAASATRRRRLDLRSPASVSYLRTLAGAQRRLEQRLVQVLPEARVRWRYGVVLNGLAVVLPRSQLGRLESLGGVTVWPTVRYHALLDRSPARIGAPTLWGPTLATAGNGIKIGIIDDGIDQAHPFFESAGYSYPAGFPKGQTKYTTPKVIVARAFPPAGSTYKNGPLPFDPKLSDHATHVAGIAAGNEGTAARTPGGNPVSVSGIAPKAYLGNYKVLTVPTRSFGLDGNSPEIAAGIEAAVRDRMDVINLSLGEPEIPPARDLVVKAIDAATAAGVVVTVAAGNDFDVAGRGSIGSPGTASKAITAAASSNGRDDSADVIADFSSSGPTPVSLDLKPDVTAPGRGILSSVPASEGTWAVFDGTSMASPHIAGAAALLRQRHPTWTVAQIKSALESTGDPATTPNGVETVTTREGGGRIDLVRADQPLLFTAPTGLSFGLVQRGQQLTRTLSLTDAGGGAGDWQVTVLQQVSDPAVSLTAPPVATVPGTLVVTLGVGAAAAERDLTGFVILSRGSDVRRIPYWFRVEAPRLGEETAVPLRKPGVYSADTSRGQSLVSTYRYPEEGPSAGVVTQLAGPELVYRITLARPAANFGAAVVSKAAGVSIQPRVVSAGDENRLVGYTGLPGNLNPYADYGRLQPVVGAVLPIAGQYDLVFDTPSAAQAGRFSFRFWVGDTTRPSVRLVSRTPGALVLAVGDAGAGVDPSSLKAHVDGRARLVRWNGKRATVATGGLARGVHRLVFTVSDYQEVKNMEDVGPILPNTRTFTASFRR